ncbi:8-oxo-dGTP diphosphatase MutT [soil metagenome]
MPSIKGPILVAAAVIENAHGEILIAQRPDQNPIGGGQWEFPGGKVEPGEDPRDCIVREIREELGVEIEAFETRGVFSYVYREGTGGARLAVPLHIVMIVYQARVRNRSQDEVVFKLTGVQAVKWVSPKVRPTETFAPADIEIVDEIWLSS